jgi:hypothetical protein
LTAENMKDVETRTASILLRLLSETDGRRLYAF